MGPVWVATDNGLEPLIEIEDPNRHGLFRLHELVTATPVGEHRDLRALLEAVAADVENNPEGGGYARVILDAHRTLDIEVRLLTHACTPGPPPYGYTEKPVA